MTRAGATAARPAEPPKPRDAPRAGLSFAPVVALPWIVQSRFLLVVGEAAILQFGGAAEGLAWAVCAPLLLLQVTSNALLANTVARNGPGVARWVGGAFVLDAAALTAILTFSGGPANPFALLYLVHIVYSATVLSPAWTWTVGLASTVGYGSLFPLSAAMSWHASHGLSEEMARHAVGMWFAFALAAGAITFFVGRVSESLRRRQQEVLLLQREIARNERLAAVATLAAGAAHEMGTPLGTIAIAAREIERTAQGRADALSFAEDAALIAAQVERCRNILADLSERGAEPAPEPARAVRAADLLTQAVGRLPPAARVRVRVEPSQAGETELVTFASSAARALEALVNNALDASPRGAPVSLTVEARGPSLGFVVRDSGDGMDAETVARVAEPFFTRKPTGRGMGLGAFIAHLFAVRSGGELVYESAPNRGTTARLILRRSLP